MPLQRDPPNFFAGPFIERHSEERESEGILREARAQAATRYLLSVGGLQLLHTGGEPRIAFLGGAHPLAQRAAEHELVLLGKFEGAWCILLDLPADAAPELPPETQLSELRPLTATLGAAEAALLAYARALSVWRTRHRFCGVCGAANRPTRAGQVLSCINPAGAHETFPRIDPAIIVLVSDGERALLGRQAVWPPGRYSTIAGFVEPGESLEDAVAREVLEETGVSVAAATYHSSQPWPFPSSLMLGFQATAGERTQIRLGRELEDAQWFTRQDLAAGRVLLPPPQAIAHRLISAWLQGR